MTLSRAMRGRMWGASIRFSRASAYTGMPRSVSASTYTGKSVRAASSTQQSSYRTGRVVLPSRTGSPAETSCAMRSAIHPASVSVSSSGKNCTSTLP